MKWEILDIHDAKKKECNKKKDIVDEVHKANKVKKHILICCIKLLR